MVLLILPDNNKKETLFKWWNIESTQKMACTFHRSDIMTLLEKDNYKYNKIIDKVMSISCKSDKACAIGKWMNSVINHILDSLRLWN